MEKCPNCNNELDKKYNFCPSCGYDLRESEIESDSSSAAGGQDVVVCDVCGEDTLVESGVCEYCGARLSGKEKKIVNSKTAEKLAKSANAEIPKKPAFEKTKPDVVKKHSSGPGKKRIEVKKIKPVVPGVKSDSKNLTSGQLGIIIVGLIAIAGIILYISGVFGSGPKPEIPNTTNSAIKMDDMQRINELETTVNSDTTKKELVLELAHRLNDSGLKEKAIKYYLMYLKSVPDNADVLVDLGVCYFDIQNYAKARQYMLQGLRLNPRHQIAQFNLGIVSMSAGNSDSAKIWWKRAAEIDPGTEIGQKAKELLESH